MSKLSIETNIPHSVDRAEPIELSEWEIERERNLIDLENRREELQSNRQDREERKKYAVYIFYFLCAFLLITLAAVVFTALKVFSLSDTILITLLTTTSADIIGIFIIVVKYLFKTK